MNILINWVLRALVIYATTYIVRGFAVADFMSALVLVLILSLFNALIKPLLLLLTLPINILTLGLFTFIINAIVLQIAIYFVPSASSDSFSTTLLASIVMSILSLLVGGLVK